MFYNQVMENDMKATWWLISMYSTKVLVTPNQPDSLKNTCMLHTFMHARTHSHKHTLIHTWCCILLRHLTLLLLSRYLLTYRYGLRYTRSRLCQHLSELRLLVYLLVHLRVYLLTAAHLIWIRHSRKRLLLHSCSIERIKPVQLQRWRAEMTRKNWWL